MVRFSLHQTTSVVDQDGGVPLYRVINQVEAAVGTSSAAFVYKTTLKTFSHYATASDFERWPDSYEEALLRDLPYYRLGSVSRTWDTVTEMQADLDMTCQRVRALANELTRMLSGVVLDRTISIEGV